MVGDSPLGPFRMYGTGEIVGQGTSVTPYASRLLRWGEQWLMIGTVHEGGTNSICDPIPVEFDETGIHTAGARG